MRILGGLASLGGLPALAWVVRCIVRDFLAYRWELAVLRRAKDDQVIGVVEALNASRRSRRS